MRAHTTTTMTILGMNGAPLPGAKKDHHPERVERERMRLSQALADEQKKWKLANQPDPLGATQPNKQAIDEFHAQQWRTVALAVRNSQEAVDVDPEAMATWIADHRKNEEVRADAFKPLKEIHDLASWDFKLVGVGPFGAVWLCDRLALAISEEGMVLVILRPKHVGLVNWAGGSDGWLQPDAWEEISHELPDLTLGELHQLLKLLRYTKLVPLPEALMAMARGAEGPTDAQLANAAERRDRVEHPTGVQETKDGYRELHPGETH